MKTVNSNPAATVSYQNKQKISFKYYDDQGWCSLQSNTSDLRANIILYIKVTFMSMKSIIRFLFSRSESTRTRSTRRSHYIEETPRINDPCFGFSLQIGRSIVSKESFDTIDRPIILSHTAFENNCKTFSTIVIQ